MWCARNSRVKDDSQDLRVAARRRSCHFLRQGRRQKGQVNMGEGEGQEGKSRAWFYTC